MQETFASVKPQTLTNAADLLSIESSVKFCIMSLQVLGSTFICSALYKHIGMLYINPVTLDLYSVLQRTTHVSAPYDFQSQAAAKKRCAEKKPHKRASDLECTGGSSWSLTTSCYFQST